MHAALAEPQPFSSSSVPPPVEQWPEPDWIARGANEHGYQWARIAWRRAAAQNDAWFDHAKAQAVVDHWPLWFKLTLDRFFGRPFRLAFWQEIIVRLLIGWKIPVEIFDEVGAAPRIVHVRLFRQLRLWVPRKNGKSEFMAALALLFFTRERVFGAEGFVFAKDEEQGRIPFKRIKTMVALDPVLSKNVQLFNKSIYVPEIGGSIQLLSGTPEGKHGKAPTVILGDEMHEWTSTEISDVLREGTGIRLQPIELYASTAGLKTNRTGVGLWSDSQAILDGRIEDPTTLIVIFAADPEDDPFDESTWAKANPSLGVSPTFQFLRTEATKSRGNPRREARFRCYHLNQWIDAEVRWLPLAKWDACASDKNAWRTRYAKLCGRKCKGSIDVSATQDITCRLLRFEDDNDRVLLLPKFWIPESTLANRERNGREPWRHWIEIGALHTTPGEAVDQDYVFKDMLECMATFDVEQWGFDMWNARGLYGNLIKEGVDAEKLLEIRQGIRSLGEGSKEFERRVFAGTVDHGGHPLLRWMAGNAAVRFDENLNFMPAKLRSGDKIDGIICAVMCEALAIVRKPQSFWETMIPLGA
jgi:phage terminase large subunit-like protein